MKSVSGSVPLTCAAFVADNWLSTMKVTRPDPAPDEHLGGADVEADLWYARMVADMYIAGYPDIEGKVAEVGPGGNAAVALYLLAQGCRHVDLVDRFEFSHDRRRLESMYARIITSDQKLVARFGSNFDLGRFVSFYTGEEAAAEIFFRKHQGYDAIMSCAVLEHLYDPLGALEMMVGALKPGGRLLHQIDLRDHGMFTSGGHHELTFLTVPTWFYPLMTKRRGRPNRVLFHRYKEALTRLKLQHRMLVTHMVGIGAVPPTPYDDIPIEQRQASAETVRQLRGRFAREFRDVSDADLSVASFFLTVLKPR